MTSVARRATATPAMRSAGFTLVEVMIALAILSMALVSLLVFTANNVFHTAAVASENIAVDLARGKLDDLEDQILIDGFQLDNQTRDGDFSEEGWPTYTWAATIDKIELPELNALQGLGAEQAKVGPDGKLPGAPTAGSEPSTTTPGESPLAGLMAMAGVGGSGGPEGGTTGGNALIASQFQLIKQVLGEAIRKITLTVSWRTGPDKRTLVVSYYVTDPTAVSRVIPSAGAAGTGEEETTSAGGANGVEAGTGGGVPAQEITGDGGGKSGRTP